MKRFRIGLMAALMAGCWLLALGQSVPVLFMEPDGATEKGQLPGYKAVTDPERIRTYAAWMDNACARMALDLYRSAWGLAHPEDPQPLYAIALVAGGNYADLGFRLKEGEGWTLHEGTAYIKLAPEDWVFTSTFLHETGHVVLSVLNGGEGIASQDLACIPHTTAALTDRGTAFNEGFAIHLETLMAHLGADPVVTERYGHVRFQFGPAAARHGEYFRQSMDLLTYAQPRSRYMDVRENAFAFAPAFKGPDYLRVQLDKARDFSELRDADQLLESEGFTATFFFSLLLRGKVAPGEAGLKERQQQVLATLYDVLHAKASTPERPYLLDFVSAFIRRYPEQAGEVVDVLLDLSHGVFVDRGAATLWREHYLGALRLDLAEKDNPKIAKARQEWRERVLADPQALYANLGPPIRCEVPSVSVRLVAFGESAPLSFDLNTAEEGVIRLVPGIGEREIKSWISQRKARAFADVGDFRKRAGLSKRTLASMKM